MNAQNTTKRQLRRIVAALGAFLAIGALWTGSNTMQTLKIQRLSRPLLAAAEAGQLDAVRNLLDQGADPNAVPGVDVSRLSLISKLRLLLHLSASADKPPDTRNALFWAAARGHADVVKLLLERGANVNQTFQYGETVVAHVAGDGNIPILKLLAERGANLNTRPDPRGLLYAWSPLDLAAMQGKTEAIRFLLEHGAKPDNTPLSSVRFNTTPLIWATTKNYPDCVKLLLDYKANPNYKTTSGETALAWARQLHETTIEKMLRDAGATR